MGLKDMMKDAANATMGAAQDAIQKERNSAEEQGTRGIMQGMMGTTQSSP